MNKGAHMKVKGIIESIIGKSKKGDYAVVDLILPSAEEIGKLKLGNRVLCECIVSRNGDNIYLTMPNEKDIVAIVEKEEHKCTYYINAVGKGVVCVICGKQKQEKEEKKENEIYDNFKKKIDENNIPKCTECIHDDVCGYSRNSDLTCDKFEPKQDTPHELDELKSHKASVANYKGDHILEELIEKFNLLLNYLKKKGV